MQELISRDEMAHVARWCELVERLAVDAEALQAPEAGADDTHYREEWQALADRWMATCWTALTPPFIAASARQARAKVCPQPLQLRDASPEGHQLVADDRYDYLLTLEAAEEMRQRHRDAVAAGTRRRPGPRRLGDEEERQCPPPSEPEPEEISEEEAIRQRRAEYGALKAAEREAEAQAQAAREARMLEIAAAAPAPDPEPEAEAQEPADDGRVWLIATELAAALGTTKHSIDHYRRLGVLEGCWRLPAPDRVRGMLYDLEACRAAIEARKAAPRQRSPRPPAEPPAPAEPLPVVIEPEVAQVPPPAAAADARAVLELLGNDPATLAALKALLQAS